MRPAATFFFLLCVTPLWAKEPLVFKKEFILHEVPYGLILTILLVALLILVKHLRKITATHPHCSVIEKIAVSHKTRVYILEYQGQKFLLADNNQGLAIHALSERPASS